MSELLRQKYNRTFFRHKLNREKTIRHEDKERYYYIHQCGLELSVYHWRNQYANSIVFSNLTHTDTNTQNRYTFTFFQRSTNYTYIYLSNCSFISLNYSDLKVASVDLFVTFNPFAPSNPTIPSILCSLRPEDSYN